MFSVSGSKKSGLGSEKPENPAGHPGNWIPGASLIPTMHNLAIDRVMFMAVSSWYLNASALEMGVDSVSRAGLIGTQCRFYN